MNNVKAFISILDRYFTGSSILGKRIFIRSFAIMLVITSIALFLQYFIEMRNRDNEQIKDLKHTVEALTPSFAGAVWQLNDRSIETLLASLTTRSEVLFAYIKFDDEFISVIEREAELDTKNYTSKANFYYLEQLCDQSIVKNLLHDKSIDDVVVAGELFVCYMSPEIDSEFLVGTLMQYIPHLLATLLVSAIFVMMVVHTVVKPLSDITRSLGEGGSILELQPRTKKSEQDDEIDKLIKEVKINTSRLLKERGITDAALMRIAEGVAVTDQQLNVLRANSGLQSILLGDSNVLEIENLQSVVSIPLLESVGESIEFETNDDRILEVFGTKIDSDLDGVEYVFLIRDLTQKRRLLEQSVQTQKLRALDTLVSGLAHDFNNLLMVINGNLELHGMAETQKSANSSYIDVALKAVQNGQKLTNQLLAFSRKQQFKCRLIPASEIVEGVTSLAISNVDPSIKMTVNITTSKMVFVDESFLESALLNLIVNSCDALPTGGNISLNVRDKSIDSQDYVEFSVCDNGMGISAANIKQVCTPFFTTKDIGKGTGLGLSMVLGFAEQSDGKFEISSELGVGTRTAVLLPARVEEKESNKVVKINDPKIVQGKFYPISVLVIDDNEQVCSVLKQQIENLGHKVTVAHTVKELEALADCLGEIELVVCDVVLQGETVLDVHSVLKRYNVPAPLVLISGNVPKSLNEKIKRINVIEIIRKPFTIGKLELVINSISRVVS